jgi:uncharacterized protein (DUF433 family)
MSQTVSLSLPDELISRIDRFAQKLGNGTTRSGASAILIDEGLREEEFPGIQFHNTSVGRQPYVKQTGMAVWEFILIAQEFDMDDERTAAHLQYPIEMVKTALDYYSVYREEIDRAIEDNNIGEERLKRLYPTLRVVTLPTQGEEASS